MKFTYRQRILVYFFIIFAVFAIIITLFEQKQEKKHRAENIEARLDGYAEMIHAYIDQNQLDSTTINVVQKLNNIFPIEIRISIIDKDGTVIWDNDVTNINTLDNHIDRPEIRNALYSSFGSNVRVSASTQQEYLYYARYYTNYFVRVALPYTVDTQNMLKADNLFIYIILGLFIVVLFFINFIAGRFSKSIIQLRNFSSRIKEGKSPDKINFPEDELGEIGNELTDIFKQMEESKRKIEIEREKLISHFQFSGEGLSIFSPDKKKIYANTNFIQYLNFITDKLTFDAEDVFEESTFKPFLDFINNKERKENHLGFQIDKNGKTFSIQVIVFDDKSFEVNIKDISKAEKTRLLKQEMTGNIAHELRTPVTSLRGYLEILKDQTPEPQKHKQFIERAYYQSLRLSNLIEDVGLISKMEEAPSRFAIEQINLPQLVNEVRIDLTDKLIENKIKLHISIKNDTIIPGNYTLLYSIFRNLIDNSISYAGQGIDIYIDNYIEDENYLYFLYYDTGVGVSNEHLARLFERFYRVNEGRTRETGGSGLGLSIVKNAVLFHQGDIQVKNHAEGGLEFHFTLKKSK